MTNYELAIKFLHTFLVIFGGNLGFGLLDTLTHVDSSDGKMFISKNTYRTLFVGSAVGLGMSAIAAIWS